MGSVTKLVIQYDTAFWRKDGYSGECFSSETIITATFDGCSLNYNALIVFVAHNHTNKDTSNFSNNEVLSQLAKLFNNNLALNPINIYRKDWQQDQFSGGCYFAVPHLGDVELYKYLKKSAGNIHFAGTETADEWYGYIEGALQSAERVVSEILRD